jgi:hypothetical protein
MNIAPLSPRKMRARGQLKGRNPMQAPHNAALPAATASSPERALATASAAAAIPDARPQEEQVEPHTQRSQAQASTGSRGQLPGELVPRRQAANVVEQASAQNDQAAHTDRRQAGHIDRPGSAHHTQHAGERPACDGDAAEHGGGRRMRFVPSGTIEQTPAAREARDGGRRSQ